MRLSTFNFKLSTYRASHGGHVPTPFANAKGSGGFVALISAIIIAVVLLIFVVGVGSAGFYTRFDIFGSEMKVTSESLANACVQTAILKIAQNESYTGNEAIPVGENSCNVCQGTDSNTIFAQGIFQNSFTNLQVEIGADFEITDITEIQTIEPCLSS